MDMYAGLKKTWAEVATSKLVGRKIVEARYLTDIELKGLGWHNASIVLLLDDGNYIYPSADDEGNDAGALFTSFPDFDTIPVI
jgi:hypothetical protein